MLSVLQIAPQQYKQRLILQHLCSVSAVYVLHPYPTSKINSANTFFNFLFAEQFRTTNSYFSCLKEMAQLPQLAVHSFA